MGNFGEGKDGYIRTCKRESLPAVQNDGRQTKFLVKKFLMEKINNNETQQGGSKVFEQQGNIWKQNELGGKPGGIW